MTYEDVVNTYRLSVKVTTVGDYGLSTEEVARAVTTSLEGETIARRHTTRVEVVIIDEAVVTWRKPRAKKA